MDEHLIDKRILERQIKRGKLDATAYRRTLESLPDRSEQVMRVRLEADARDVEQPPVATLDGAESA